MSFFSSLNTVWRIFTDISEENYSVVERRSHIVKHHLNNNNLLLVAYKKKMMRKVIFYHEHQVTPYLFDNVLVAAQKKIMSCFGRLNSLKQ